jgi:hypothetical protein
MMEEFSKIVEELRPLHLPKELLKLGRLERKAKRKADVEPGEEGHPEAGQIFPSKKRL